jgi:serine phosphatase RsbU (regulator of sigma subunit)
LPLEQQKQHLLDELLAHQQNEEQGDDITLMGIKLM